MQCDVAIIGLGVVGSAVAYQLSARGLRVVGLDRFGPCDPRGASYGESRMLRRLTTEPPFEELTTRAYQLWDELESTTQEELLWKTGCLIISEPGRPWATALLQGASRSNGAMQPLRAHEVRTRFPGLRTPDGCTTLYDEDAAVLPAERVVYTLQRLATARGAQLRFGVSIPPGSADACGSGVALPLPDGSRLVARHLVLAPGAWAPQWVQCYDAGPDLSVERTFSLWLPVIDDGAMPAPSTIVIWDAPTAMCLFPPLAGRAKIGVHHTGQRVDPDQVQWAVQDHELDPVRDYVRARVPAVGRDPRHTAVGLYTNAPGGRFAVDWLCEDRVLLASACSGQGFKFAPVVGEYVADLIEGKAPRVGSELFRFNRGSASES